MVLTITLIYRLLSLLRSRGRQRLRWTEGICSITKLPVYSCYTKAQNRHEWRNFIRTVTNTQIWVERRRRLLNVFLVVWFKICLWNSTHTHKNKDHLWKLCAFLKLYRLLPCREDSISDIKTAILHQAQWIHTCIIIFPLFPWLLAAGDRSEFVARMTWFYQYTHEQFTVSCGKWQSSILFFSHRCNMLAIALQGNVT